MLFWLRTYSGAAILRGLVIPVGFVVWVMVLVHAFGGADGSVVDASSNSAEVCIAD
jgi:hypothetical protein